MRRVGHWLKNFPRHERLMIIWVYQLWADPSDSRTSSREWDHRSTEEIVAESLAQFDPTWDLLNTAEKSRLLRLLIERVDYDGAASTVSVTYRPTGFRAFAEELQGVEA